MTLLSLSLCVFDIITSDEWKKFQAQIAEQQAAAAAEAARREEEEMLASMLDEEEESSEAAEDPELEEELKMKEERLTQLQVRFLG